jgi:hypothetical protein
MVVYTGWNWIWLMHGRWNILRHYIFIKTVKIITNFKMIHPRCVLDNSNHGEFSQAQIVTVVCSAWHCQYMYAHILHDKTASMQHFAHDSSYLCPQLPCQFQATYRHIVRLHNQQATYKCPSYHTLESTAASSYHTKVCTFCHISWQLQCSETW